MKLVARGLTRRLRLSEVDVRCASTRVWRMRALVTQIRVTLTPFLRGAVLGLLTLTAATHALAQDDVAEDEPEIAPPGPDEVSEPAPPQPTPIPPAKQPAPIEPAPRVDAAVVDTGEDVAAGKAAIDAPDEHEGSFGFGSYGRVIAATDGRGRPGRDVDVVAHGSRLDHDNYVELELRRDDRWAAVDADTRFVATVAFGNPIFHYDGEFDAAIALRNLYLEERGLGARGLSIWAGSRMLRGDDIYLLDFWPLDNLNTLGGGVVYEAESLTKVGAHFGVAQPDNPFYRQQAFRPQPLNQFGAATVDILDRMRLSASLRAEQQIRFDGGAGIKLVLYGEMHQVPGGQRETAQPQRFEDVPHDDGYVIGGQIGGYTGEDDTHVNLFVRYATGTAAYGEFAYPEGLGPDRTTSGAHEITFAAGGNWELGPVAIMLGGYFRSFRNATDALDYDDVDEGIVIARPQIFFTEWLGLGVEGSYQAQQRGVIADVGDGDPSVSAEPAPVVARIARIGVIPFVTPAGRGSYSRPVIWLIYSAANRDDGARALFPVDDNYSIREWEHFIGLGAEWWFGSTSYGEAP
jgi:maltoporin